MPVPPAGQQLPRQERGVRRARALPYTLHADGRVADGQLGITFRNDGEAAAVFQVRSARAGEQPSTYTVGPGRVLVDSWAAASGYNVAVHGPNGFFRAFRGGQQAPALAISTAYDERAGEVTLDLANQGGDRLRLTVTDAYAGRSTIVVLRSGQSTARTWKAGRTSGWHDLTVTVAGVSDFAYQYAGHLENGRDSISDPAMGGLL